MASHCSRREGDSSVKFFKIIVNPRDNKIRLPKDFITQCCRSLPTRVTVKVPNGLPWKMELILSNGETWIHKGWKEFKDYYSIELGHMLIFKYNWISHFDVEIFDLTALEIKYPVNMETGDSVVFVKENLTRRDEKGKGVIIEKDDDHIENDVPFEIFDSRLARRLKRRSGPNIDDIIEENSRATNHSRFKGSLRDNHRSDGIPRSGIKLGTARKFSLRKEEVDEKRCAAYERAKAFKSDNPFAICVMRKTFVSSPFRLNIPITLARENLSDIHNNLRLCVSNEKTWSVRCTLRKTKEAYIIRGWSSFVRDNGLQLGDVCIFEVNKRNKLVWNVIIFRS